MTNPNPAAPLTEDPMLVVLPEWVEDRRRDHAALGHKPTSVLGYCAEDDGISAGWCVEGIWLRAYAAARATSTPAGLREATRELVTWAEKLCADAHKHGWHDRECPVDRARAALQGADR